MAPVNGAALLLTGAGLGSAPGNGVATVTSNALNTLGVAYYRLGRLEKAVKTLEGAVKADKGRGSAHDFFFLAMSYQRLGDTAKAEGFFAKAVTQWKSQSSPLSARATKEFEILRAEAAEVLGKQEAK